jgi:hypothetical protein
MEIMVAKIKPHRQITLTATDEILFLNAEMNG